MSFAQDELTKAILRGDLRGCEQAISMGADVNHVGFYEAAIDDAETCVLGLLVAANQAPDTIMKSALNVLIRAGADINGPVCDRPYISPLVMAAMCDPTPWFDRFLNMGADPLMNRGGETTGTHQMYMLMGSASASSAPFDTLHEFLSMGIPINAASDSGVTVLHMVGHAMMFKKPEVLHELFLMGADPFIKNSRGKTPLQDSPIEQDFLNVYHQANRQRMAETLSSEDEYPVSTAIQRRHSL